jgi:FtsZ-interacting cell division protein ZipA
MESASFFGLIGILTAFFSKNMIVIFLVAIIITNVVKFGTVRQSKREGLANKKNDKKAKETVEAVEEVEAEADEEAKISVENSASKEKFGQDKAVIRTTDEDKELDKSEKMILAQENMLKRMNKYKPLLDTLNGITKNMAAFKGASDKE